MHPMQITKNIGKSVFLWSPILEENLNKYMIRKKIAIEDTYSKMPSWRFKSSLDIFRASGNVSPNIRSSSSLRISFFDTVKKAWKRNREMYRNIEKQDELLNE